MCCSSIHPLAETYSYPLHIRGILSKAYHTADREKEQVGDKKGEDDALVISRLKIIEAWHGMATRGWTKIQ